ncbi:MAG TPA: ribonuclease D [Acidocella sp.]|uniref:ribonuclease D n=1 Tax=Acidocella sp. TaxID=50710 RepID=UPI002B75F977|nr:ribonuclease D [Acidocella sp.]HVE23042.1 ribonuclease D [Acidocella sp.]
MTVIDTNLITTTAELAALCERLGHEEFVTVDTEFMREKTYYPELCLVQLAGEEDVAVVDAQAKGIDLAPLGALLAKPDVVKVFHACRQDVEIFLLRFGAVPENLFDTQVAAMVAGFGDQVGYDALVSALTGGHIDKAHRFSDWSARPLTKAQVDYAAADVTHLRAVYEKLTARLRVDGRLDWVAQEMAALADPASYRVEPERAWERLKLRTNNRRQLAIVQAIAAWREREAQRVNIPRQRLVRDEQVPEIAALAPDNAEALAKVRGITAGFAQGKSGQSLLAAIAAAKAISDEQLPRSERQRDTARASPALVALLKVLLNAVAEQNNVAPRLVASSEDVEALALDETAENPALQGWRREMFGEDALRLIRGEIALSAQGKKVKIVSVQE